MTKRGLCQILLICHPVSEYLHMIGMLSGAYQQNEKTKKLKT